MDIFLHLLKQLSETLSPTEFLIGLSLIFLMTVIIAFKPGFSMINKFFSMIINFFSKNTEKSGIITAIPRGDGEDLMTPMLVNITKQIEAQTASLTQAHDRIIGIISNIQDKNEEHNETLRSQITEVLFLKKDLEAAFAHLNQQLEDSKHSLKMHEIHEQQLFVTLKEISHRALDLLNRIVLNVEKVDEFARATVPEFRSYHKELSKEVSGLSRDVALVERSLQSQLNSMNAVKLR